jgi:hypothetical protein
MFREKSKPMNDVAVEQRQALDAMLAFSQTQILAQVTDEASLDSRTIGLIAFNGALLGGTLAAKTLLGYYWWAPLVVVALATGPCLWSVFKKTSAFGPPALRFYREFGAQGPLTVRTQLLADLDDTFDFNAGRVKWKTLRLRASLATLVIGLGVAALLIAVVRPTTMKTCRPEQIRVQVQGSQSLCLPRQDFRLSAPGA